MPNKEHLYSMEALYDAIENNTKLSTEKFLISKDIYSIEGIYYRDISEVTWKQREKEFRAAIVKIVESVQKAMNPLIEEWFAEAKRGKAAAKNNKSDEDVMNDLKKAVKLIPPNQVANEIVSIVTSKFDINKSRAVVVEFDNAAIKAQTKQSFFKRLTDPNSWRKMVIIRKGDLNVIKTLFGNNWIAAQARTSADNSATGDSDVAEFLKYFELDFGTGVIKSLPQYFNLSKKIQLSIKPNFRVRFSKDS